MRFTVIVPAHNEEQHLPACLSALRCAAEHHNAEVELVVVLNRCADATERITIAHSAHSARVARVARVARGARRSRRTGPAA